MKTFDIPSFYRSDLISAVKAKRKSLDPRKKDFSASSLDFGEFKVILARHFGFCFGVENAIERAYAAIEENPGKRIFLLSQMIHNPEVNEDLQANGISFIQDTHGNPLMGWDELTKDDLVIIPAFGTTVESENKLKELEIETKTYDTTCPFVAKVWNRAEKLGSQEHTVIIHGKPTHEETRATFSHSYQNANSIVIEDMKEAESLSQFILGKRLTKDFYDQFKGRVSKDFNPEIHLEKIGVVNQTTMLASETQAIADYLKSIMEQKFGEENIKKHFANTRDTLCYATNDNQQATFGLLKEEADLAIVIGGYNSSNTSHLVELCEEKLPTYFIKNENEIESEKLINHFNWRSKIMESTQNWLDISKRPKVIVTSGASCPDSVLERVIRKIHSLFPNAVSVEEIGKDF